MNWDKQTAREWDALGFYYEYDDNFKQWRFFGSRLGLQKYSSLIRSYATDLTNKEISEHIHIGPYNYLKIMTWDVPIISRDAIAGPLNNLLNLGKHIHNAIESTAVGSVVKISDEYSGGNKAMLLFIILADDFIPSSIEF